MAARASNFERAVLLYFELFLIGTWSRPALGPSGWGVQSDPSTKLTTHIRPVPRWMYGTSLPFHLYVFMSRCSGQLYLHVRFQVLMAMSVKMTIFGNVALCSLVVLTDVSEQLAASIITMMFGPLKRPSVFTRQHGATSQKTVIFKCTFALFCPENQ
jgi:hypothetical protein